jgi:uncharacterized membrane-anchored protein
VSAANASRRTVLFGCALALACTTVLGSMLALRAQRLESGTPLRLKTITYDPYDLMRGQYSRLTYAVAITPDVLSAIDPSAGHPDSAVHWVVLRTLVSGETLAVRSAGSEPEVGIGEILVKGSLQPDFSGSELSRTTAILILPTASRVYVPEGQGPELDLLSARGALDVTVRVDASGTAQIERVEHNGAVLVDEPSL